MVLRAGVTGCSRGGMLVHAQDSDTRVCGVSHVCDVPWTPAECACAVCPRHVATAPEEVLMPRQPLVLGCREGWGPMGFWVTPWAPVPALAGPAAA